jgi:hypothetical protein
MFFRKKNNEKSEDRPENLYKPGLLFVELMFEDAPIFQIKKILSALKNVVGDIDIMTSSKDMTAFILKEHPVKYKDAEIPSQCILFSTLNKIEYEKLIPSLLQTRDRENMNEIVKKCRYKIAFSDFMPNRNDEHTRLSLFNNALKVIINNLNCKVLHFLNSQILIRPDDFIDRVSQGNHLAGALNVRLFNIQNSEDMLMDTLGLHTFGLPDIQCHFKELDPNEIARVIYNAGYYIFDKGDIIDDGNTIQGVKENDKWECQHEESLVEPNRIVLDINPGSLYAAGGR